MKPAVLVLPGWASGPELLASLVLAGTRVVAADWDRAGSADDLPALALEAAADLPGEFELLGWSLGAMVALEILPTLGERVLTVTLVAPCLRFTEGWPVRVLARMRRRCADDPASVLSDFARQLAAPGEDAPVLRRDRPVAALLAGLDYLANRALPRPTTRPLGGARVLHGGADAVIPPALSEPVAEALGAKRWVLVGAGHAPQLSRAAVCAAHLRGEERHAGR